MSPGPDLASRRSPAAAGAAAPPRRQRRVSWRFRRGAGAALGLSAAQRLHVAEFGRRIASGAYRLEHGGCCCGATDGDVIAQVDRYGIALDTVLCSACGTLRCDPYLTVDSLAEFYRTQYQDMYARVPDPDLYFARQIGYGQRLLRLARDVLAPDAVVAEVGCGAGGALSVFGNAGFEAHGCDYSERLIDYGRRNGVPNLYVGDTEELVRGLDEVGRKADLVFLHHVFEHLASPAHWLAQAESMLAEGGMIVAAVPDVSAIDAYPSPAGDLRLFLHVAHKFNFSFDGLAALAERVGLHAWLVDVEPSTQAPELWVAFTRSEPPHRGRATRQAWHGPSTALFARLQTIEMRYLRAAAARKIIKSLSLGARYLGRLLPILRRRS